MGVVVYICLNPPGKFNPYTKKFHCNLFVSDGIYVPKTHTTTAATTTTEISSITKSNKCVCECLWNGRDTTREVVSSSSYYDSTETLEFLDQSPATNFEDSDFMNLIRNITTTTKQSTESESTTMTTIPDVNEDTGS